MTIDEIRGERRATFLEERLSVAWVDPFLVAFSHWKRRLDPEGRDVWVQFEVSNGAFFLAPRGEERLGLEVTLHAFEMLAAQVPREQVQVHDALTALRGYAANLRQCYLPDP